MHTMYIGRSHNNSITAIVASIITIAICLFATTVIIVVVLIVVFKRRRKRSELNNSDSKNCGHVATVLTA